MNLLQHVLESSRRNVSLRALSAKIGLSPATLSQVASGKRRLTVRTAVKMADALSLSPLERKDLLWEALKDMDVQVERVVKNEPGDGFRKIQTDEGCTVSDWHFFAILSLGDIHPNYSRPEWISRALGIDVRTARQAFQKLEDLDLVMRKGRGFRQVGKPLHLLARQGSAALRTRYAQLLDKAQCSLASDPVNQRDFSSMTMAIDEKKIEEARELIRAFRQRMCQFLESGTRSRVYSLSIQLFPISQSIKRR